MQVIVQFIARLSLILYILCAIGILLGVRAYVRGHRARHEAVFGLEREAAYNQRRRGVSAILSLLVSAAAVYIISNIIAPNLGQPTAGPTPGPMLFATEQATATQPALLFPTVTPTIGVPGQVTPVTGESTNGCEILGSTIYSPQPGQTVSGQVQVEGEANILNFSKYKFEINGPSTGGAWVVVGTYSTPVASGILGAWDSTSLQPGTYQFRLVVVNTEGNFPTPCQVSVVVGSPGAPPTPSVPGQTPLVPQTPTP
jgi:hypothetical protein